MHEPETCVSCGKVIPEGMQVCPDCDHKIIKVQLKKPHRNEDFIFKGDVFFANLNPVVGSEVGGIRPVVVIQNDIGNRYSSTVIAAITSRTNKRELPTHVKVANTTGGLYTDSVIMLEQIRTIDKSRLLQYIGRVDEGTLARIEEAAKASLGFSDSIQ